MYIRQVEQSPQSDIPSRHLLLEAAGDLSSNGKTFARSDQSIIRMMDNIFGVISRNVWFVDSH